MASLDEIRSDLLMSKPLGETVLRAARSVVSYYALNDEDERLLMLMLGVEPGPTSASE